MNIRSVVSVAALSFALAACAGMHPLRVTDTSQPRALPESGP